MTPTIGRIVLYRGPLLTNGAPEAPAIVTRVWSDTCVNITVFRDYGTPEIVASVPLDADKATDAKVSHTWRWMEYQKAVAAGQIPPAVHAA